MNKTFDPPVCIGFECVEPFTAPGGIERFRGLSRRYHVREAAETFCRLVKREHPKAYVREVMGMAMASAKPKGKR